MYYTVYRNLNQHEYTAYSSKKEPQISGWSESISGLGDRWPKVYNKWSFFEWLEKNTESDILIIPERKT